MRTFSFFMFLPCCVVGVAAKLTKISEYSAVVFKFLRYERYFVAFLLLMLVVVKMFSLFCCCFSKKLGRVAILDSCFVSIFVTIRFVEMANLCNNSTWFFTVISDNLFDKSRTESFPESLIETESFKFSTLQICYNVYE